MNVIVWRSRDNRLFTVDVKWLWRLASTNNCAWLEHFSTWPHLNTWGVCEMSIFSFSVPHITKHCSFNWRRRSLQQLFVFVLMADEIDLTNDYISQRGLYLSVFEANIAIKFGSPLGKWETVCGQWSNPFLSSIEFPPTKEITPRLSIEPLISHVLKFLLSEGHSLFLH